MMKKLSILIILLLMISTVSGAKYFDEDWVNDQRPFLSGFLDNTALQANVNGGLCQSSGTSGIIDNGGESFTCNSQYTGCILQVFDSKYRSLAEVVIDSGSSEFVTGTYFQWYTCSVTETMCPDFTTRSCGDGGCSNNQLEKSRICTRPDATKYTESYCILDRSCDDAVAPPIKTPGVGCPVQGCNPLTGNSKRQPFVITNFRLLTDGPYTHGQRVEASVTVLNNGVELDDDILEFALFNTDFGFVELAIVDTLPGFCPKNLFVDTKRVELNPGEKVTIKLSALIPKQGDIDHCNAGLASAYNDEYQPVATLSRGGGVITDSEKLSVINVPLPDDNGFVINPVIATGAGAGIGALLGVWLGGPAGLAVGASIGAIIGFAIGFI